MKAFLVTLFLLLPTLNDPKPLVWEDLMDVEWTYDGEFYQVKFGESAKEYDGKEMVHVSPRIHTKAHHILGKRESDDKLLFLWAR
jgi:hypothetical protein